MGLVTDTDSSIGMQLSYTKIKLDKRHGGESHGPTVAG
jgi:hypothetical protein